MCNTAPQHAQRMIGTSVFPLMWQQRNNTFLWFYVTKGYILVLLRDEYKTEINNELCLPYSLDKYRGKCYNKWTKLNISLCFSRTKFKWHIFMMTSFLLSAAQRSHYYELCTAHFKKINCIEFAHLPLQDVCRVTHELPLTVKSVRSLDRFSISLHVFRGQRTTSLISTIFTAFTSFRITLHMNFTIFQKDSLLSAKIQ
jgi:hypothetical protein